MHGWRSKIIFLLVVYFGGFVTGIYCIAPVPETEGDLQDSFVHSVIKSDEFAKSFNSGVHKCISFGKETAERAGEYIKQKIYTSNPDS